MMGSSSLGDIDSKRAFGISKLQHPVEMITHMIFKETAFSYYYTHKNIPIMNILDLFEDEEEEVEDTEKPEQDVPVPTSSSSKDYKHINPMDELYDDIEKISQETKSEPETKYTPFERTVISLLEEISSTLKSIESSGNMDHINTSFNNQQSEKFMELDQDDDLVNEFKIGDDDDDEDSQNLSNNEDDDEEDVLGDEY